MGEERGTRDIFDKLAYLIVAAVIAFALTWGLSWLKANVSFYFVFQIIFYAADVIILMEILRISKYACIGYAAGLVIGILLFNITFGITEILIYFLVLVFNLYRLRSRPRN
jgi:hypothetical protein